MKAGFLGVGNMGGGIARRLLAQGVELFVFDPSDNAVEKLGRERVTRCESPRDVADRTEIVCACLPTVTVAEEAAFGPEGASHGTKIGTYVEFSTVGTQNARDSAGRFAQSDIDFVDAAVSGGAAAAESGNLAIMLAAGKSALEGVEPLLKRVTDHLFVIGDRPGDAQTMKLMNNLLASANMATSAEVIALGTRLGLDPGVMVNVLNASSARSLAIAPRRMRAILAGTFDSGPRLSLLLKDIDLAETLIAQEGASASDLPSLQGMIALWTSARDEGLADEDVTALIKVAERRLGVEARSGVALLD